MGVIPPLAKPSALDAHIKVMANRIGDDHINKATQNAVRDAEQDQVAVTQEKQCRRESRSESDDCQKWIGPPARQLRSDSPIAEAGGLRQNTEAKGNAASANPAVGHTALSDHR